MNRTNFSKRILADLGLLAVAATWGGTFVMVKDALAETGPFAFLALRFGLASLGLLPLLALRRGWYTPSLLRDGSVAAVLIFSGYAFQTVGLQFTSAAKAGFITGLSVVVVPVVLALHTRKLPSPTISVGVVLATIGLGLISLGDDFGMQVGDLLVLGCAFGFGLHVVVAGHYAPKHDVVALTTVQVVVVAVLNGVVALLFEQTSMSGAAAVLPAALFTGLSATGAAFLIQFTAQRFTTATHAALIFTTEPVFAGLFAYWLAGEQLTSRALIGSVLILAGMLVAQLRNE